MRIHKKLFRTILFLTVSLFIVGLVSIVPSASTVYADTGGGDPKPKTPPDSSGEGSNEQGEDNGSLLDPLLDLLDKIF